MKRVVITAIVGLIVCSVKAQKIQNSTLILKHDSVILITNPQQDSFDLNYALINEGPLPYDTGVKIHYFISMDFDKTRNLSFLKNGAIPFTKKVEVMDSFSFTLRMPLKGGCMNYEVRQLGVGLTFSDTSVFDFLKDSFKMNQNLKHPLIKCTAPNSIQIQKTLKIQMIVFPNPAKESISISGLPLIENGLIELISIEGKVLKSVAFKNSPKLINVSKLPNGVYLCTIKKSGQLFSSSKFNVINN